MQLQAGGRRGRLRQALLATFLVCGLPALAHTLPAYDQGSVSASTIGGPPACNPGDYLSHDPASTLMRIGTVAIPGGCFANATVNAYALFNVPLYSGGLQSALVKFELTANLQPGDSFSWQAHDVSSPAAAFQVAYSGLATPAGTALLLDLGSGVLYGSGVGAGVTTFSFQLLGTALLNLNAAQGGVFAIGFNGRNGVPSMPATATLSNVQLEVSGVPEPRASMLMVAGLALAAAHARRRRAKRCC
jgi:hypothetical protein